MSCKKCFCFLQDFLLVGVPKELPAAKYIRIKALQKILPEYTDWMYRLCFELPKEEFEKAYKTASQIAKRGRKQIEYECIVFPATSNFLSFSLPWFSKELEFMKVLLVEAGFIRAKYQSSYLSAAREYLTYIIPRCIFMLKRIHDDHMHPKGLITDISTTLQEKEVEMDDLYT